MPFRIISDTLNKIDQFITHWGSVNAALGTIPLTLRGVCALATLNTDRTAIATRGIICLYHDVWRTN